MMFPEADCIELYTGGTLAGQTRPRSSWRNSSQAAEYNGLPAFKVLDELAVIGEDVDLKEFVNAMLRKMDFWEEWWEACWLEALERPQCVRHEGFGIAQVLRPTHSRDERRPDTA